MAMTVRMERVSSILPTNTEDNAIPKLSRMIAVFILARLRPNSAETGRMNRPKAFMVDPTASIRINAPIATMYQP